MVMPKASVSKGKGIVKYGVAKIGASVMSCFR